MEKVAIYPGTFDPVTNGHIDLMQRATKVFDRIIVAVAQNGHKSPLLTLDERFDLVKQTVGQIEGIEVESFSGLVVEYARKKKVPVLIRGLRMFSDFEYEFQMALTNRRLAPDIETVFLMPSENYSYLSSTLMKEAVFLGADISAFVPDIVASRLKKKLKQ